EPRPQGDPKMSLQIAEEVVTSVEEAPICSSPPRGFAAMTADRQREIASMGGKTAHERGRAHQFTAEEARQAGKKGGETVSRNRDYMVAIGRRGGNARSVSLQLRQKASA